MARDEADRIDATAEELPAEPRPEDLKFEPMQIEHLDQVLAIERSSYPTPWSARAFLSELQNNVYAHYVVALLDGRVCGYSGMWLVLNEAHITNIAIHPAYRGRKLGDALLAEMERRARERGMTAMTLEVRVSNHVAQKLYKKRGFVQNGLRKGYYTDNHEDAIIMWKDPL